MVTEPSQQFVKSNKVQACNTLSEQGEEKRGSQPVPIVHKLAASLLFLQSVNHRKCIIDGDGNGKLKV
eukprot:5681484-Pleurochrysis_carterae.AAC.1